MADNRNRSNVIAGAPDVRSGGAAYIGDAQTDPSNLPQNEKDEIPTVLNISAAGFVGEEGLTKAVEREAEQIPDWNGDTMMTLQSSHTNTLSLEFAEAANVTVLKAVKGENNVNVSLDGTITVAENADELPHRSFIFEMKSGKRKIRLVVPDGQVTETDEEIYNRQDIVRYGVTITCYPDQSGNKVYVHIGPEEDSSESGE